MALTRFPQRVAHSSTLPESPDALLAQETLVEKAYLEPARWLRLRGALLMILGLVLLVVLSLVLFAFLLAFKLMLLRLIRLMILLLIIHAVFIGVCCA